MKGVTKIDGSQLVVLLTLSKIFTLLTFSSNAGTDAIGYVEMLAFVISTIIQFVLLIPSFILLKRNKECGIIECSFKVNKIYGKVVSFLFLFVIIMQTANTIASFEFFMTTAIYPNAKSLVFIGFFILAIAYSVFMGLEAFSRLAGFVLIGAIIGTATLIISVSGEMNMLYFHNPLSNGWKTLAECIYGQSNISMELILLLLLAPFVNESVIKPSIKYFMLTLAYFEAVTFAVLTSLGNLSKNELFPVFTMAIISELSFLERLDTIYMAMWIFIAFIRTSVMLFLSVDLLKYLLPNKVASKGIAINSVIIFSASMYLTSNINALAWIGKINLIGVPMLIYIIIIPVLTLFLTRKKSEVSA